MNKKSIKFLSLVLAVMMLFCTAVSASAEGEAVSNVNVTLIIEGLRANITSKTVRCPAGSTVKAIVADANIDAVFAEDGVTINSVKGENAVLGSKWQYAVDGVIKADAIDTYKIEADAKITLYNASEDAVWPSFNADDVATMGVVTFTGTDKNGAVAPIEGATITWENLSLTGDDVTALTDKEGKIYLAQDVLQEGKHTVKINRVNSNNVPTVVRFTSGTTVEVPELEDVNTGNKTFFEKAYDFLYSILKGVIDVWAFYIKAIVDLFT